MADSLQNLLREDRSFPPPPEFAENAVAKAELYEKAAANGPAYWAEQARERLTWDTEFTEVLDWTDPPFAKWFADGTLNAIYLADEICGFAVHLVGNK